MERKTIEFDLMTHNIFVDSPRNAVLVGADQDLFAALPDALKTEVLALKIKRDQAMQRAMAKISDYLTNPNISHSDGKVVIDDQIQGYIEPRDPVLLAMEKPKLAKGRDHADAASPQTSTNNFDGISTALKDEAKLLDAREEAIIKREVELAKREEDIKLVEAAKSLTLHAKSQATSGAMNSATAAPQENKTLLYSFSPRISSFAIKKYKIRPDGDSGANRSSNVLAEDSSSVSSNKAEAPVPGVAKSSNAHRTGYGPTLTGPSIWSPSRSTLFSNTTSGPLKLAPNSSEPTPGPVSSVSPTARARAPRSGRTDGETPEQPTKVQPRDHGW